MTDTAGVPPVPTLLEAVDVTVTYGTGPAAVTAVSDLTLQLHPGQMLCLAGRSGSGKTSVLSTVSGLLPPTSGHVFWGQDDLYAMSEAQRSVQRSGRVGIMFQGGGLLPRLTALENSLLSVMPALPRSQRRQTRDRAKDLLTELGLKARLGHFPAQLSGGEQQRVALARALLGDPATLVIDEPTAALDARTAREIIELLTQRTQTGALGLLVASHDQNVISAADDVIELESN